MPGLSSSELILFLTGDKVQAGLQEGESCFPSLLGLGIHLQMTLGKRDGLEIIACASTGGKHAQSLVHSTQQDGWMGECWLLMRG